MADLPETIRIGYADYKIERWQHHAATANSRYGEFSAHERAIRIDSELFDRDPVKAANTLLHETLHAIHWVYDIEDDDKEERNVTKISNALTQVWRDNPKLVAWLDEQLGA